MDGAILGVDPRKNLVSVLSLPPSRPSADPRLCFSYFSAAKPSIERHIYSASLPVAGEVETLAAFQSILTPLDDVSRPGYFSARFSPEAGYYVEAYDGPGVPRQRIVKLDDEEGGASATSLDSSHCATSRTDPRVIMSRLHIPSGTERASERDARSSRSPCCQSARHSWRWL